MTSVNNIIDSLSTWYGMGATKLLRTTNDGLKGHDRRRIEQTWHIEKEISRSKPHHICIIKVRSGKTEMWQFSITLLHSKWE